VRYRVVHEFHIIQHGSSACRTSFIMTSMYNVPQAAATRRDIYHDGS